MASAWIHFFILGLFPFIYKAQIPSEIPTLDTYNSTLDLTNSSVVANVTSGPSSLVKTSTILATTPSIATTTEKDDWTAAENFLYTGDPTMLEMSRCNRAYSPMGQTGPLPYSFNVPLRPAMDALANSANFLNMIFQASDLRESTVEEDMEWYHALVRALLDADVLIQKAYLTFDADPAAQIPQLVLRATQNRSSKVQTIILQDMSKFWDTLHPPAPAPDDSWFRSFKFPENNNRPIAALSKRVLLNDLDTLDTPKWRQGDSYVTNGSGVRWASAPFLDCEDRKFVPGWMLTLSTAYYGLKPDLTPEFRGVIRADVNIQDIDVDQCAVGNSWFADTHQCNRTSMECVPIRGRGFRLGQYCCRCREGYYNPELTTQDTDGLAVNWTESCYPSMPVCLPCFPGCSSCQDGAPCWVQEDWLLRAAVLAVQGVFMLLIFVSMMAAYRHRRNKRIRASGLLLLETILFGSLLLYFPVFILYFRPSAFRCILLRWVRMLGFSIVYGTVTLKMYRVLKVFLSRTAQRVPYMSSLHLMRILAMMLMTVSWFLCAWTVGVLQNRDRNIPVYVTTTTSDGQGFNLCYLDRWDYMMAVAELLFLCWGSSLWTAVRPVPSAFHEPRYMGIAIHNELLLSTVFHLFRFTFPSLHPDWMLLLCFSHTHFTITVTLALLFLPKFLYVSKPGREEIAAEVYEDEVDLRRSYLNSSFTSAWSEPSVDPDDFRDELKKLYAQLEVSKTKKMAANNPHLPKKRSSRCAIGRSIIKRITEFPETVSRQCSRDGKDGSFRSHSMCHSDSFRRSPDNVSISYRSSILTPTLSIRKSQSDHHSVKESEPSLRDSTRLRPDMIKRCSQRSETDSLDMPSGVCKSASAQNLTIDTNLLYPDHTRLHKTWSLTSTPTHSVENVTKVSRCNTVLSKSRESISIGEQTRSALQSEAFDKSEVCPWEVEPEPCADKNQKHVTIANSNGEKTEEKSSPSSPMTLICPWDHLPPPVEKKPSEDVESPKPQLTVSASAPASPRPKIVKDQRVFSFRATTSRWLSVKSFVESIDSVGKPSKDLSREDSQKSHASTTPRGSSCSSRRPSVEKKALQKRSLTTADGKPCLVKQNAIRLSSGDSSERSPIRLAVVRSTICPWDVEDVQREGTYENVFLSRQNSKRSSVSSWETGSHSRTPSMHRRGSKRLTPARNLSHADVCPWDSASQQGGNIRQQSIKAEVCPWESQASDRSSVCPRESQEHEIKVTRQGSGRGDVCPWETQAVPVNPPAASKDLQTQQSLRRSADVYGNVCPWESQDKSEAVYENINPIDARGSLKVPLHHEFSKPGIHSGLPKSPTHLGVPKTSESCPWDFPDPPPLLESICPWEEGSMETSLTITKKDSTTQMTIKVDVCPWESVQQESLEDRANICPWETEQSGQADAATKMPAQSQERLANVCPWESQDMSKTEPLKALQNQEATYANIRQWESETGAQEVENVSKKDSSMESLAKKQDTSSRVDVCPWKSEDAMVVKTQDSGRADVCPWETEEPQVVPKQDSRGSKEKPKVLQKQSSSSSSNRADVCPWVTQDAKVLRKQDSSNRANVCPWESEEPKELKKQDSGGAKEPPKVLKKQTSSSSSSRADLCPWEGQEPKEVKKQDSVRTEVCPWEEDDSKDSNRATEKQDSSGSRPDVCPWETQESVQKQDSGNHTDVCPWETEDAKFMSKQDSSSSGGKSQDAKVFKKQDSVRTDVCPWETEEAPKVIKKQESISSGSRTGVCPWEVQEPKVFKRQDSKASTSSRAEVCPWESEEPKIAKQDSRAEVCPWEGEVSKVVKKQDSKASSGSRAEVCPWESEAPKVFKKQDSKASVGSRADVCPLETQDSKVVEKQDSRSWADVCPWEGQEPKVVKKQDSKASTGSRAEVCPWESEEPKVSKQDSSGRADVCPWEGGDAEVVKKQDSGSRNDVCSWETEEAVPTRTRQDSTGAEVRSRTQSVSSRTLAVGEPSRNQEMVEDTASASSPEHRASEEEEAKANLALGRRDALCPWEMGMSGSGSFTDNASDVFTWEPENIPEEEEEGDAESAAEALVFPPDL